MLHALPPCCQGWLHAATLAAVSWSNDLVPTPSLCSSSPQAHYLQENGLTGAEGGEGKRDKMSRTPSHGNVSEGGASAAAAAAAREASAGGAESVAGEHKGGVGGDEDTKFASSAWKQYKTLFGRELLSITRNPFDVAGRTLTFAWVGIVMGVLYYGMPVGVARAC